MALWTASSSSSFSSSTSDKRRRKTAFAVPYRLIQAHVIDGHPIDHAVLTEADAVRQLRGRVLGRRHDRRLCQ